MADDQFGGFTGLNAVTPVVQDDVVLDRATIRVLEGGFRPPFANTVLCEIRTSWCPSDRLSALQDPSLVLLKIALSPDRQADRAGHADSVPLLPETWWNPLIVELSDSPDVDTLLLEVADDSAMAEVGQSPSRR